MPDKTTIQVDQETWKRLYMRKQPGESYDSVIQRLLDETKN